MIHQISPTIPVEVLEKGKGFAVAWIDYSEAHDLIWLVCMRDSGEFFCVPNQKIKAQPNWTMRIRTLDSLVDKPPPAKTETVPAGPGLNPEWLMLEFKDFITSNWFYSGTLTDVKHLLEVGALEGFLRKCGIYPKDK